MVGMGEFNSDDHHIYYCGQESLRRKGVALIVNEKSKIQYLVEISKMTEWSLFPGKSLSITVIQVNAPTIDVEEAKVEWLYEDLQHLLELAPKKMSFSS